MKPSDGVRATLGIAFVARAAIVFAVLLLPIPWLADGYTTTFGRVTNALLSAVDARARVAVRFEPGERIEAQGSWRARLRLTDRQTGREHVTSLDVRSLSYRPMATFVALAVASSRRRGRRGAAAWLCGGAAMLGLTLALSALPLLARFGAAGGLGPVAGAAAQTAYQALATPVMVMALAVAAWGCTYNLIGRPKVRTCPSAATSSPAPSPGW